MQSLFDTIRKYDYQLYLFFHRANLQHPYLGVFFYFFSAYGVLISVLSSIYLIWQKRVNALICSTIASGIAIILDIAISLFWNRPRPFISHPDLVLPSNFNLSVQSSSFPSSHTYIAFAIATSVLLYGHKRLGTLLFIVALLVAISRIGVGLHYPSDVIGGALLGVASGIFAYLFVHKWEKNW